MLGALLIVKVIFKYFVKTESGSICLILPKMWRYCHKKCVLAFFLFNTPCHQKTWFFFFARFYFCMYISCSLDCSIYHWKLVIHQSIKDKYSFKKNLKLIFKAKHLPISTHVHTNFWIKHFTKVISCYVFQSIHVLLYIYYHIIGEWGMNVAYRFILWVAVIFIERNDLLLKKSQLPSPQMTMPLNCIEWIWLFFQTK